MPFSLPAVAPPPPIQGATPSTPLNYGLGAGIAGGTQFLMNQQYGDEVGKASLLINLVFQLVKHLPFNQHFWYPFILAVLGIGLFIALAHGQDIEKAILNGGAAAFQSALNYHSLKVAGINILPAAANP